MSLSQWAAGSLPTKAEDKSFFFRGGKMGETKRYYWLKLPEEFFDDDTIDFIASQENGEKYCLFYLKLCLKALKSEGKLIRFVGEMVVPYDEIALAKLTRTDVDTVRSAIILFTKIGLIKRLETGEIFLTQINEMVGKETDKAKLMRKKRLQEKQALISNNVTQMLPECYTEKEIEKDIDIEIDRQTCAGANRPAPEDVFNFYITNKLPISPERFWRYNNKRKWKDKEGKPIKDWQRSYLEMCEGSLTLDEKFDPDLKFNKSNYDFYTGE